MNVQTLWSWENSFKTLQILNQSKLECNLLWGCFSNKTQRFQQNIELAKRALGNHRDFPKRYYWVIFIIKVKEFTYQLGRFFWWIVPNTKKWAWNLWVNDHMEKCWWWANPWTSLRNRWYFWYCKWSCECNQRIVWKLLNWHSKGNEEQSN